METVKRIEIIANSVELPKILDGLEKAGVPGYSVIRGVAGKSTKGRSRDLAMTMLDNIYVLAFCEPDQISAVAENIRPVLNKFGGSCFISDAVELLTTKCVG
ncbi:P-II family nitrogen regulator [Microcoleus sp. LEGE 07076]|uniref:P-II family nitrogen regulator n=1 Tax=Microcoleus sp. LEGE 07076 TaxID=915322 RepID=UPI00187E8327|nr:P-II family nitrogen regulator [Microcoleus sp. LEGE 07076]MBE9188490.1 P-II family nitrogen regulator [Microcoleus sp. LEGE 07076]